MVQRRGYNSLRQISLRKMPLTLLFKAVMASFILLPPLNSLSMIHRPRTPEVVVDETWFSDPNIVRELGRWYALSKTLAEDAARNFLNEYDIKLVVINPGASIGPVLQPELNLSSSLILNLINGSPTFQNYSFGWINVKDVANAHIQAYEIISSTGRYCLIERVAHFSEVADILRHMYPTLKIPEKCEDDEPFMPTFQVSKEKAKSLGIEFIPLEVSLRETVESLKEKKFVDF
ncbi:hypothetical protein Fmac_022225 [Flemingia macrophylla]|uniref:Cinnamoyl-CoA reductase n=1 Tax=Flemingia macrophylla TaxID=520843 RepID=A0ABD1LZ32_9FABA